MSTNNKRHQRSHLNASLVLGSPRSLKHFQAFLLEASPLLSPSALALGCLVGFDMVVRAEDLPHAYAALQKVHRYQDRPSIRWVVPPPPDEHVDDVTPPSVATRPVYDERTISDFTHIATSEVVAWQSLEESIAELLSAMDQHPEKRNLPRHWEGLLASAQVHAVTYLPGALRGHVVGQIRMSALDPSAAAREATQLALVTRDIDLETEEALAINEVKLAQARLRHPLHAKGSASGSTTERDRAADLVDDIVRATHAGSGTTEARAAVSRDLRALHLRMGDSHHWPRTLHLVALNWVHEHHLAMSSISRYFSGAAKRLFVAVQDMDLVNLDVKELVRRIEDVHASVEDSNKPSVRAVGQAILDLLVTQEVIEPAQLQRVQKRSGSIAVRAQVIFPHECSRAMDWVDEHISRGEQGPALTMTRLLLGLVKECGFRMGEALRLRLENFCFVEDRLQVAVNPTRSDPRVKTKEGRRLTSTKDPRVIRYLVEYLASRHGLDMTLQAEDPARPLELPPEARQQLNAQLAERNDLLFADPHQPGAIWCESEVRMWTSVLLKCATGDLRSVPHDLRHSWVTFGNEANFCTLGSLLENPFDQRANALGHAGNDLMFTTYTHQFGQGIRVRVDQQLIEDGLIRTQSVAAWTARSHASVKSHLHRLDANLRKKLSRAGAKAGDGDGQHLLLKEIQAYATQLPLRGADEVFGISLQEPISPLTGYRPRELTTRVLLQCLVMLASSTQNADQRALDIARLAGIGAADWARVLQELWLVSRSAHAVVSPRRLEKNKAAWLVTNHWAPVMRAALSEKWQRLMAYLDRHASDDDVVNAGDYVLESMGCDTYLPVDVADPAFIALVRVIRASGMNLSSLHLHYVSDTADTQRNARHALAKIRHELGIDVQLRAMTLRGGRPPMYLSVRSRGAQGSVDADHDGSAHSMQGFAGLFLGAYLKSELLREQRNVA
ncbi:MULTISPECIES: hypothetical protein [unclassified Hydrogenophaga]|uniref:hypothetical protein n=1 Tax=unclassified Hydrogenophaga TaxID=2610897 RepID=UPI000A66F3A2|nr:MULTISPECIES: hypothetical protein [unclassified Hydrogenophaga]MBN9373543.1 hypothetical protein [Hydrogenophaga sp.]